MATGLVSGRQAPAPVDKPAGGGRSCQCRGGSGRHVGSRLGGVFKTKLVGWRLSPSACAIGGGDWFAASGVEDIAWRSHRVRLFAASGPRGERRRRVSASILSISAETAGRVQLPVPAVNNKET